MRANAIVILIIVCWGAQATERPEKAEEKPKTQPGATITSRLVGKGALGKTAGVAALQEIRNSPPEWQRTLGGFGKRLGSAFGKHLIKGSVQYGVATVLHEELSYHRSETPGFFPRFKHALLSGVITRKTTTLNHTPATGRISGSFASGFLSRLWHPARFHTVSSAVSSAGISLAADAGANMVREFWPEIRRVGHRRPPEVEVNEADRAAMSEPDN